MWKEILAEPAPDDRFPIALALWHHARGVAYANTDRIEDALEEAALFEEVAATIPEDTTVRRASSGTLIEIARNMMWGEILFKQGRYERSFAALRAAVAAEDTLPYSEPPGWMQPMRHTLGALLLEAGRLRRQGRFAEADDAQARFEAAWADTPIEASCFCRVSG